jgi:hypothetical protein
MLFSHIFLVGLALCGVLAQHPTVGISANEIDINDKQDFNMYLGKLFLGSRFVEWDVVFDTANSWTVISDDFDTASSQPVNVYGKDGNLTQRTVSVHLQQSLHGPVFTDDMCLIQNDDGDAELTLSTGRLCVQDMPFVHAQDYRIAVDGSEVGGIVGLAPKDGEQNYVRQLYDQRKINYPLVGINYEPWGVRGLQSRISFGFIDFSEIEDGENGLNFYSNLGRDHWGLMMDDLMYNGMDMTDGQGPKVAIIDSGNITIQLPEFVFDNMLDEIKAEEGDGLRFYAVTNADGSITMEADKPCEIATQKLKDITFKLQTTTITLRPKGYIYEIGPHEKRCQIGIEKLKGVQSEYRLGSVFLRNFYTGLDYKNDMIYIGVNKGQAENARASIHGRVYNPFKPRYTIFKATLIILFFGIIICGVVYYVHRKQEFEQEHAEHMERLAAIANGQSTRTQKKVNPTVQDESVDLGEKLIEADGRQTLDEEK